MTMWDDLFAAVALLLVFEGIMPFVSPSKWRQYLKIIIEQPDRTLRTIGLVSMLMGAFLLIVVRSFE